jgi:hypothetical protein
MDIDIDLNFDQDGLFQVIKQWMAITHLEIYGIRPTFRRQCHHIMMISPPVELLRYIKSLSRLSSLVLYGIGAATSVAYTLFMQVPMDEPLLPMLSFLLAIVEMSPNNDLSYYLLARQCHRYHLAHSPNLPLRCSTSKGLELHRYSVTEL